MPHVVSKFADNAKNAVEQKDVKLTGIDGSKKIPRGWHVGTEWQMSSGAGQCKETRRGETQ